MTPHAHAGFEANVTQNSSWGSHPAAGFAFSHKDRPIQRQWLHILGDIHCDSSTSLVAPRAHTGFEVNVTQSQSGWPYSVVRFGFNQRSSDPMATAMTLVGFLTPSGRPARSCETHAHHGPTLGPSIKGNRPQIVRSSDDGCTSWATSTATHARLGWPLVPKQVSRPTSPETPVGGPTGRII